MEFVGSSGKVETYMKDKMLMATKRVSEDTFGMTALITLESGKVAK